MWMAIRFILNFTKPLMESLYMLMEIVILKIAEIGLRITFIRFCAKNGIIAKKISGGFTISVEY